MYGIAIDHLEELIQSVPVEHGNVQALLTSRAEYSLERLVLRTADEHEVATTAGEGATIFVEAGALQVNAGDALHKLVQVAPGCRVRLRSRRAHHRLHFPRTGRRRKQDRHLRHHL